MGPHQSLSSFASSLHHMDQVLCVFPLRKSRLGSSKSDGLRESPTRSPIPFEGAHMYKAPRSNASLGPCIPALECFVQGSVSVPRARAPLSRSIACWTVKTLVQAVTGTLTWSADSTHGIKIKLRSSPPARR